MNVDSAGVASLGGNTRGDGVYTGRGTDREDNGAIGLNGNWYTYSDDCEVFYVDADDNVTTSSISGITKDGTDRVFWKETNGEVTTIVICEAESGARDITGIEYTFTMNDVSVPVSIAASGNVTTPGAHEGLEVEITDVTTSAGATWTVVGSDTATVAAKGATPSAANQITIEVTAENGRTTQYTIGFVAGE